MIWIHDIHRICPLKLDLSPRKKIIGVAFDPTKLEAMEVEFFSHFEAKVEKCFFFRENLMDPQGGVWDTKFIFRFFFIDLPKQPKERIPNICFIFSDLEVRFFDTKRKLQIPIPPEILCTVVRPLTLSGQKYDF